MSSDQFSRLYIPTHTSRRSESTILNISLLVYSEVMFDTLMTIVIVGFVHNEQQNVVSVRDNDDKYIHMCIYMKQKDY